MTANLGGKILGEFLFLDTWIFVRTTFFFNVKDILRYFYSNQKGEQGKYGSNFFKDNGILGKGNFRGGRIHILSEIKG